MSFDIWVELESAWAVVFRFLEEGEGRMGGLVAIEEALAAGASAISLAEARVTLDDMRNHLLEGWVIEAGAM